MIIFFLIAVLYVLKNDIKTFKQKDRFKVLGIIVLYFCFMLYYTSYINDHSYTVGSGIPGADMLAHYSGAKLMSRGAGWSDLVIVAGRFEEISISTIGYFLYTTFVYITCFLGDIIPSGFCIYLLYIFQILLSIDACVKFSKVFALNEETIKPIHYFIPLVLCIPFVVQACQLMRDVYFMWFISVLLEETVRFKNNNSVSTKKRLFFWVEIMALFIICIVLRYYTIIVTLPLFLYYYGNKKLAMIVSLAELGLVTVGTAFLMLIKDYFGVFWKMTNPNLMESVSFLLFPNIINQTKYIFNWQYYFGNTLDVSGCNVPGIYFVMAIWNILLIPFILVDFCLNLKKSKENILTYLPILLTTVALYSVTYDAIDTRHKFFMSLPIVCLSVEGYFSCRKKLKGSSILIPLAFFIFFTIVALISIY